MKLPSFTWLGALSELRSSRPRPARSNLAAAVAGGLLLAAGVRLLLAADLGVAPLDVALVAISDLSGVGLGFVALLVQATLLTIAWRLGRPPVIETWIFMITVGLVLQALTAVPIDPTSLPVRVPLWAAGFGLMLLGVGLVAAETRAGASLELLSQAGADRGLPKAVVRTGLEASILVIGVVLGGPLGLGTLVFALVVGPAVVATTNGWTDILQGWAHSSVASSSRS